MRAITVHEFGGPEVLTIGEVADPRPGPAEVLIDVEVTGVLTIDTMIRAGQGGAIFPEQPPYVPGKGAAGRVDAVGEDVDPAWVGRQVLADTATGGYAERLVAEVPALVPIPTGLGIGQAMALMHDAGTALAVFEPIGVTAADRVLVLPASGGLGSILVQLARAAGAEVIGVAGDETKRAVVATLGAQTVCGYDIASWPTGVDVVFDGVGGETGLAAFERVRDGGRFSDYGMAGGPPTDVDRDAARAHGITFVGMEQLGVHSADNRARLARVARALESAADGRLTALVGQTFPLARAADAHAALQQRRAVGKTLLVV